MKLEFMATFYIFNKLCINDLRFLLALSKTWTKQAALLNFGWLIHQLDVTFLDHSRF